MAKRPNRPTIERFKLVKLAGLNTRERAKLPCGCCIYVGRESDGKVGTLAQACSEDHAMLTEMANALLAEWSARPADRLLIEVCAQALNEAKKVI